MEIAEIEQLLDVVRDARISELAVSMEGAKVKLRKPLLPEAQIVRHAESTPKMAAASVAAPQPAAEAPAAYITAPMVGIFHAIDSISIVGTPVKAGQVVGAIESMKLMNDVTSEQDGVIADVMVDDGMPVEYGQHLFRLETES
jgi:biotin carboxyl carrier protein